MVFAPVGEAGPARRLAVVGAGLEVAASRLLEQRLGLSAEAYTTGKAHRLRKWSEYLTVGGAVGAVVAGRSRPAVAVSRFGTAGRECPAAVRCLRGGGGVHPRPEVCGGSAAGTPRCRAPSPGRRPAWAAVSDVGEDGSKGARGIVADGRRVQPALSRERLPELYRLSRRGGNRLAASQQRPASA